MILPHKITTKENLYSYTPHFPIYYELGSAGLLHPGILFVKLIRQSLFTFY